MLLKVNQVVNYVSHNVTQNGVVKLNFKAMFDELTHSMELLQMLTSDIGIKVKLPDTGEVKLIGTFKIAGINFTANGQSTIKLASINNAVEFDNINDLISPTPFRVQYTMHVNDEKEE